MTAIGLPRIFEEEKLNALLESWQNKHREATSSGSSDDIFAASVYIDALQAVRRLHDLPKLSRGKR